MEYKSILKETFCADDLLYQLRGHHNEMFRVFEKYCTRGNVKDSPSSLRIEDMGAMLSDAGKLLQILFRCVYPSHTYTLSLYLCLYISLSLSLC